MDFIKVGESIVEIDSPDREVNQNNAEHNAENYFFIHLITWPDYCLKSSTFGQVLGDFVMQKLRGQLVPD